MILDGANFPARLQNAGVTVVTLPPALLKTLPSDDLGFLRVLITAGEPADVKQAAYLSSLTTYYNAYGPTECSVCVSIYKVTPADATLSRIPIGKPIANTRVYILNETLQLLPVGIQGEIFVAGAGLANGYLHQPELTAEKFITNPFDNDELLYRTGDIGRWLPGGNIEFLGRTDDQVKIRGYRVELGEIENTIARHQNIDTCVVVVHEAKGEKQLIAYYSLRADISDDSSVKIEKENLKDFVKSSLPEYMVPSLFIEVERFPVNISGKIDKKALPRPDVELLLADQYTKANSELETRLVTIWQDLLDVEQVGITDDFFELGGHSLLAIRLISMLRKELDIEVEIGLIFEYPTIEKLAAQIAIQTNAGLLPAITKQARPERIPLSFSQERLYFIDRLQGSVQYHVPAVLRLKGTLNISALEQSLRAIINRHEVLRTVILEQEGQGYQLVLPEGNWQLAQVNGIQFQGNPDGTCKIHPGPVIATLRSCERSHAPCKPHQHWRRRTMCWL